MGRFKSLMFVGLAFMVGIVDIDGSGAADMLSPVQMDAVEGAGLGEPLSGEQLKEFSGGQDIQIERILEQITNAELNGQMSRNILNSTATGYNLLATGALNNVNGIATVIQNSGNQVIINSATILNIFTD